ncbi:MAG: DUF72 domain-containing protein [Thermoplasmata archaeon]|uniref:DUF72 domain-containing protein n=1 Tax=Candidatus Sysuiplasma superficiale TaxID=2823368 RepID=A0A8J8CFL2_9ARCH|nr:DUF72 domain-containing protein [Candidatus Sysuiplasma superficiale]MBX8643634.1 DUF72 domain-containing protein [Candidatus Sysuiplasma superficiale]MCL4347249.1 DUF72 domain-containing protein [Candidatus Thermoplasmatota archaeon]
MNISVGCSGWSYTDWIGPFYPKELSGKHSAWLRYYAAYFSTTEVNSTFYSFPSAQTVDSWIEKTEGLSGFQFSLKIPRTITHELLPAGRLGEALSGLQRFENVCIEPLAGAGRLGAILFQLPPDFRFDGEQTIASLKTVLSAVEKYEVAVEFRDRSWLSPSGGELREEVLEMLSETGSSPVFVDSPAFTATGAITSVHAYFRFHGRNEDIWFRRMNEQDSRMNRYDYLYSRGEMESWVPRIRYAAEKCSTVRIYFNNHGKAKAPKNAMELMDLLRINHPVKEIRITDQFKLGSFGE